jgi:asparagine synthase (glutamine-hydrolysing)
MCGIIGRLYHKDSQQKNINIFLDKISHRGESDFQDEIAYGKGWTLGANRLAITSHLSQEQPYKSENLNSQVVLNGEIYNFKELLLKYNIKYTNSDGEALANLLEIEGIDILNEIDGIFAFIWVNIKENYVYISTDHIGIKPLYYAFLDNDIIMASEIKALAFHENIKEIKKLDIGSFIRLEWDEDDIPYISENKNYFSLDNIEGEELIDEDKLEELLTESVRQQVDTDKPIGVYLSGGIDSSTIYALARKHHNNVVPLILNSDSGVDGAFAIKLSQYFGDIPIVGEAMSEDELFDNIPNIIKMVESFEPNLIRQSSVSIHIAKLANLANVKIVLTGEGADELFCGYPDYRHSDNWKELRLKFLKDLHQTQLKRVDRTSMFVTTEARVPFLTPKIIMATLNQKNKNYFLNEKEDKVILREATKKLLPEWIRNRKKVVLSEGVGLKGNNPEDGMFASRINKLVSDKALKELQIKFSDWNIETKEEAYYFKIFHNLGYSKAKFMKKRITSNLVHSIN